MRIRRCIPLWVVLGLFVVVLALLVLVVVRKTQREPAARLATARTAAIQQILEETSEDSPRTAEPPETFPSGKAPDLAAPSSASDKALEQQILQVSTQLQHRYLSKLSEQPFSFPANLIDDATQNIKSLNDWIKDDAAFLDDYDKGRLKQRFPHLTDAELAQARDHREEDLQENQKELANAERLLDLATNCPEDVWKELDAYVANLPFLRAVEQGLRTSPDRHFAADSRLFSLFTWRALLEVHASRYDAALASFDTACTLVDRMQLSPASGANARYGAYMNIDSRLLPYLVESAPLDAGLRRYLLSILARRANPERLVEAMRLLSAVHEKGLDQSAIAQLKLDSASGAEYQSPYDIAQQICPFLAQSPEEGIRVLMTARDNLRAISGAGYAVASPSFFGPKGKLVRYAGYALGSSEDSSSSAGKPPLVTLTQRFVDEAISLIQGYRRLTFTGEVLRTVFALRDYKAAHGQYPERLEQVTPDFLSAIPIVPWTGEHLVYYGPESSSESAFILSSSPSSTMNTPVEWGKRLWTARH